MKDKKYRLTKQRKIILEKLVEFPTHPSADELYEVVRKLIPNISLGTVYRNLEVLCDQGYAVRAPTTDKKMHFDANTQPHFHLKCRNCGKIKDIFEDDIHIDVAQIEVCSKFKSIEYKVKLTGLCPDCTK